MTRDERAGLEYLTVVRDLVERLRGAEWPNIQRAAQSVADALESHRQLRVFGTGHSHLLAEELYYRAGGLVEVRPVLFEGLMLHASAPLSTALERLPGLAGALFDDDPMSAGDVLIVASNSGGNAVTSEFVQRARGAGVTTVAITSIRHATSSIARGNAGPRLHELADIVVDNGGAEGDAAVSIDGLDRAVGPTSTVVGAAIVNAIVAEAVQLLTDRGAPPDIYVSANMAGGDVVNATLRRNAVHR